MHSYQSGQAVGFDVQINDDDGSGSRAGISNWSGDMTGMGYTTTKVFGVLLLNGETDGMRGDANCDNIVDVSDAVMIARYAAADPDVIVTSQGQKNGDVDGVPGLTPDDAMLILQYIAKFVTVL